MSTWWSSEPLVAAHPSPRVSLRTPRAASFLLEAGPAPRSIEGFPAELTDSGTIAGGRPGRPAKWSYLARLAPARKHSIARARILGGSTTINGSYFERARDADFVGWSTGGNDLWTLQRILPRQRRLERDLDDGETRGHGFSCRRTVLHWSTRHRSILEGMEKGGEVCGT